MPVKETTRQQYYAIRNEYTKLTEQKEFGVQKHSTNWIICKLAKMFFKSPTTIENIIYHRV
jgi:hypothetical protein